MTAGKRSARQGLAARTDQKHPPALHVLVIRTFATCAATTKQKCWQLTLTEINKGEYLMAHFKALGITSNATLLAYKSTFIAFPDETELQELHADLVNANKKVATVKWPTEEEKGLKYLRTFLVKARALTSIEGDTVVRLMVPAVATTTAPVTAPVTHAKASEANKATGAKCYEAAEAIYQRSELNNDAEARIKYEIVGALANAYKARAPISYPLTEYTLELHVSATKEETYEHMGRTFTAKEPGDKPLAIVTVPDMLRAMEARSRARTVAGSFDIDDNAVEKAKAKTPAEKRLTISDKKYIVGASTIKTTSVFFSPEGQAYEIEAMNKFMERFPHVAVAKCVSVIDVGVQKRVANLLLEGYTGDAAVYQTCTKSPELYAASLVEGAGNGADGKQIRDRKVKSEDDKETATKRRIEQQERQIKNLKAGKNGAKTAPIGGARVPGATRAPGPDCPPGVCKDYNFKFSGCPRGATCTLKHECAECGLAHPFRTHP